MAIFAYSPPDYKHRKSGLEPLDRIIPRLIVGIGQRVVSYNSRRGNLSEADAVRRTLAFLTATDSCGVP